MFEKYTNKMIERRNLMIDEFADRNDVERKKELEDYNKLVYVYEEALDTLP